MALAGAVGAAVLTRMPLKGRIALRLIALAGLPAAALVYAQAPNELVTYEHQANWMIDEHAGTIRGVGLGDTLRQLQTVFGPGVRWRPTVTDPVPWNLPGGSVFDGPSNSVDAPNDVFIRYPHSMFEIRHGKIGWIKITDQRAGTTAGLGPGDSIRLVSRSYPEAVYLAGG